jgi:predicted dehydrogenase
VTGSAVGIAIVGAGFMGAVHAEAYAALGGRVRVRAVCSRSLDRATAVAAPLAATATTELADVLADPAIDGVDLCVPPLAHRSLAEQAYAAGKHVLVEKPIALTLDDADAIAAAADRAGTVLMVAHVCRFSPEYRAVARRLEAGALGRPLGASARRLSAPADWNTWMGDPAQTGGVALDLLVHDFDVLVWLLGRPVTARALRLADDGHVVAAIEFAAAPTTVEGSGSLPASYPFTSDIRIRCEHGALEAGYRAAAGGAGGVGPGGFFAVQYEDAAPAETLALDDEDAFVAEVGAFVDAVATGRPPAHGTYEQARDALAVALAVNRSLRSGRAEPVA